MIEGYELYGVPPGGSASDCEEAFANILSVCVEQQNFFGGEVVLPGIAEYSLTNARGSLDPILSGTGAVQASTSQVGSSSSSSSTFATITPSSSLTQSSIDTQITGASTYTQPSFFPLIPTTSSSTSSTGIQNLSATNNGSIISATSSATNTSPTVNCQENIPADGPPSSQIANALQSGGGTGNGIAELCAAGTFNELGDSTHMTFDYGSLAIELIRTSPTQPLIHCNDALNAIVATCIIGSTDYGGIYSQDGETYNITNLIAPANPFAFPPSLTSTTTAPTAPPTPSQIRSNNHGSALCDTLAGSCKTAFAGYKDTYLYTEYTSYLADPGDKDPTDLLFGPIDGCAAMFACDNDAAYAVGMLGSQIKAA